MNNTPRLLAAVDMGSNSFRLMIGRVDETPTANGPASQIFQVDALREPVRLAAGLTPDKYLDQPARAAASMRCAVLATGCVTSRRTRCVPWRPIRCALPRMPPSS